MQVEPHCKACKWKDTEGGCPFYIGLDSGFIETDELGRVRIMTGCFMQQFFRILGFVCKTSVGAAAAVEGFRNDIVQRVEHVGDQIEAATGKKLAPRPIALIASEVPKGE
jgi:hypothetical protein